MSFTYEQVTQLLKAVNEMRVSQKDGKSHLEAYDVRAHMIRIFGFGNWSDESLDLTMLYEQDKPGEQPDSPPRWRAAYRASRRMTVTDPDGIVHGPYDGSAVGTNFGWLPDSKRDEAHDMAVKTAESQALKRCATNLGDQFGLSLYNKYRKPNTSLVGRTLVMPDEPVSETPDIPTDDVPVDEHIIEQLAPENVPDAPPVAVSPPTSPPPPEATLLAPEPDLWEGPLPQDALRDRVLALVSNTDLTVQARKAGLTRVLMDANSAGLKTATVADGKGQAMTLEALITACISNVKAAS